MDGLQRSEISFRRSGSSGLVWDDKVLSSELKKLSTKADDQEQDQDHRQKQTPPSTTLQRSRSDGGRGYRASNVTPSVDPPSPKVTGCCSGVFGKKPVTKKPHQQRKPGATRRK